MIRSAADLGAGLAPARAPRPLAAGERIHVLGVAGAGASAAALLGRWAGAEVSGCDPGGPSPYTPAVVAAGIPVTWEHDPSHVAALTAPARLAVTKALTAVAPDHPELAAARAAGLPIEAWQQVVADAGAGRRLIAVAGTHGKSTAAGWLVHVLASAGRDPGGFVGALLPASLTGIGVAATARRGLGPDLVVEADEYAGNFDAYRPALVGITNVDWDHPDVFPDLEASISAFEAWLRAADAPAVVLNAGDPGAVELGRRLDGFERRWVALADTAGPAEVVIDLRAAVRRAGPDGTEIELSGRWTDAPRSVQLRTAGRHNVANALVVAGLAREAGASWSEIAAGLASFGGVGRRLEAKGEIDGVAVYDDYGHHPTAIRATIEALRGREPGRRLWAVYEPLTYHRTAALLGAFAESLATADAVAVAEIWAGRDPDTTIVSAETLAAAVRDRRPGITSVAPGSVEATADWLAGTVQPGDVVLVMGGGRSYRIAERLLEGLGDRA